MKKLLVRSEEGSLSPWGIYPGARPTEELVKKGIVIVDKPQGPTSHQVTSWVREILGLKKAGHAGTLDPRVSGVLPVALGEATKAMPALASTTKEYVAVMHIHRKVEREKILEACSSFLGTIVQVPPRKSAVARRPRKRRIHELTVLEVEGRDVLMRVVCDAGVYIRKLCSDIGEKMGVKAHMQELRRTRAGIFTEKQSVTLQDLKDAVEFWKEGNEKPIRTVIHPVELAVDNIKAVVIKDSAVDAVCNGAPLAVTGVVLVEDGISPGDLVGILTLKGELVALASAKMSSGQILKARKGIAAATDRVFMRRGTYPDWRARGVASG